VAILLDTHVWIWTVHNDKRLLPSHRELIQTADQENGVFVSAISCWEITKLVQLHRITLNRPIDDWFRSALDDAGIHLIALTPEIAIESTHLPGNFHRDPSDEIIVATARVQGLTLLTMDRKIQKYPHVKQA
jgi:PIN domain nuclease of toxin-antitoxin system